MILFPILFATLLTSQPIKDFNDISGEKGIIVATKQIQVPDFPGAFNPSLIEVPQGFLLSFRYCPDPHLSYYLSYIGVILLNDHFEPISHPQILNTRPLQNEIPSQSEDARLFSYRGRIFVIFNDNPHLLAPEYSEPRDIYIAELLYSAKTFSLTIPTKFFCEKKREQTWQKNWVPWVWDRKLLLSYSINPHEILEPNLLTGECYSSYRTKPVIEWNLGTLRGGTPALFVDGEYLAFFHSGIAIPPEQSQDQNSWFYFMGAYAFSAQPPFALTKITTTPIIHEGFYLPEVLGKKVIFPGGFVEKDSQIYLAYGKDDREIWVATIDKKALQAALKPLPP